MRHLLLLTLLPLTACATTTGPSSDPYEAAKAASTRFTPPDFFEDFWDEVNLCIAGLPNWSLLTTLIPYEAIRFYHHDEQLMVGSGGEVVIALQSNVSDIYLTNSANDADVKHEMLHVAILVTGHPEPPFGVCAPRWHDPRRIKTGPYFPSDEVP